MILEWKTSCSNNITNEISVTAPTPVYRIFSVWSVLECVNEILNESPPLTTNIADDEDSTEKIVDEIHACVESSG